MEISEAQFQLIEHCLPMPRGHVSMENLNLLNAILHVAEHGCKWRGLPAGFALPDLGAETVEEIRSFIESLADAEYVPGEWFQMGITLRETGGVVGECSRQVSQAESPSGQGIDDHSRKDH